MRQKMVLTCVVVVLSYVSFSLGHFYGAHVEPLPNILDTIQYGTSDESQKAMEKLLSRGNDSIELLLTSFANMGRNRPISSDRKIEILEVLRSLVSTREITRSVALGAFEDPDPRVRRACMEFLSDFKINIWGSTLKMISNTYKVEQDEEILNLKKELLTKQVVLKKRWPQ